MSDLTIGEIGKVLQLSLYSIDTTVNPPVKIPLDLTNATTIQLIYIIAPPSEEPIIATDEVAMSVVGPPANGVVEYIFQSGDLAKPANMGQKGLFWYSVKIVFNDGTTLYTNNNGKLTIKNPFQVG